MMKRLLFLLTAVVLTASAAHSSVIANGISSLSNAGGGTAYYSVVWSGETTTTYTATPYAGLSASYTDASGITRSAALTFTNGSEVITSPNYPTNAGVYTVIASTTIVGDTLDPSTVTATLTILPAKVSVERSIVQITKFFDGNRSAEVANIGTLSGVLGNDSLNHAVVAYYDDSRVGFNKKVTVNFSLSGADVANYELLYTRKIDTNGAIIDHMLPDPAYGDPDGRNKGLEVEAYGYCSGNGTIFYHLLSGQPDQYRLYFDDPAFSDVYWTYLDTPGVTGSIDINIPAGIKTGDYTAKLLFRNHNCPSLHSAPITITFHVNLPETYVMPLFDDVIAVIDTCHCLTDIQWYHRELGETQWTAIEGATRPYYQQLGGLTGEYFVSCRMDGVETFTCPQNDMDNLIKDNETAKFNAYPNPTVGKVCISTEGTSTTTHTLSLMNTTGVELMSRQFDGNSTTIDMSNLQPGTYIVVVDGKVTRVIKN
jgi:hypothetical protein